MTTLRMDEIEISPIETHTTNKIVDNGWGGNKALPVTEFDGGKAIAFVIPKQCLKAMLHSKAILSVVLADDGSISLTAQPIVLEKSH